MPPLLGPAGTGCVSGKGHVQGLSRESTKLSHLEWPRTGGWEWGWHAGCCCPLVERGHTVGTK